METQPTTVSSTSGLRSLLAHLLDTSRTRPVCVIAVLPATLSSPVDVATVCRAAGAAADVFVLASGPLTLDLADALPEGLGVYGGAARIYPPGVEWQHSRELAPLLMARNTRELGTITSRTVQALTRLIAIDSTPPSPEPPPVPAPRPPAPKPGPRTSPKPSPVAQPPAAPGVPRPGPPRQQVPSPPRRTAPPRESVTSIDDAASGAALAAHLLEPERSRAAVVVSLPQGSPRPLVDAAAVADEVAGLADVYVLRTGEASWAFASGLPPLAEVYGGASRVYPPGVDWLEDVRTRSVLRFCYRAEDAAAVQRGLVGDAMRYSRLTLAHDGSARVPASGRVVGVAAGRGLVRLDSAASGTASIAPELLTDSVPAERMLVKDQWVSGMLETRHMRLDVSSSLRSPDEALTGYTDGAVVLGLLRAVERSICMVELFPDLVVAVDADDVVTSTVSIDLRGVLSEGEVVLARIVEKGASDDTWRLSLQVDPDEVALTAPSLLPDGPPWLVPPEPAEPAEEAPEPPSAPPLVVPQPDPDRQAPVPAESPLAFEAQQLRREVTLLQERLQSAEQQIRRLRTARRNAESKASTQRSEADRLRQQVRTESRDDQLFVDAEEQLRFDIMVAWARRIPADEKSDKPLAVWTTGPHFFESWDEVSGVERSKVIDVLVEVLTGQAWTMPGREAHQLRTGTGGSNPARVREDGATAWRFSLQVKTPSARRLHVWALNDGAFELSSIRLHDDYRD